MDRTNSLFLRNHITAQFGKGNWSEAAEFSTEKESLVAHATGTEADLPHGWREHYDPDSGWLFYYNDTTGVSQWSHPLGKEGEEDPQFI